MLFHKRVGKTSFEDLEFSTYSVTTKSAGGLSWADGTKDDGKATSINSLANYGIPSANGWGTRVDNTTISSNGKIRFYCDCNSIEEFNSKYRNYVCCYELDTEVVTDVTDLFEDFDNYIVTEPNGTIELHNTNDMAIDVPSTIAYGLKVEV